MAKLIPMLNLNESVNAEGGDVNENVLIDLWNSVQHMWNDPSHYTDGNGTSDMTKGEYFRIGLLAIGLNAAWMRMAFKDQIKQLLTKAKGKISKATELAKAFKSAKSAGDLKAAVAKVGGAEAAAEFEKKTGAEGVEESLELVGRTEAEDANESALVELWNSVQHMWNDPSHYTDGNGTSDLTKGEYFRIGLLAAGLNAAWMRQAFKGEIKDLMARAKAKITKATELVKAFKSAKSTDQLPAAVAKVGGEEAGEEFKEKIGTEKVEESLELTGRTTNEAVGEGNVRITRQNAKKQPAKVEESIYIKLLQECAIALRSQENAKYVINESEVSTHSLALRIRRALAQK